MEPRVRPNVPNAGTIQNHAGTMYDGIRLGGDDIVPLSTVGGIIGRVVCVGFGKEVIVVPVRFEVFGHREMQFF